MDEERQPPKSEYGRKRPPPRPPHGTIVGLGPDDDSDKKPRVTIAETAVGEGKFIRKSDGLGGHFGHVVVKISPNGVSRGNQIIFDVPHTIIPAEFAPSIDFGINEALVNGPEYKVVDVIVRVVDGSFSATDSSELAFKLAGIFAVKDAMAKVKPVMLG